MRVLILFLALSALSAAVLCERHVKNNTASLSKVAGKNAPETPPYVNLMMNIVLQCEEEYASACENYIANYTIVQKFNNKTGEVIQDWDTPFVHNQTTSLGLFGKNLSADATWVFVQKSTGKIEADFGVSGRVRPDFYGFMTDIASEPLSLQTGATYVKSLEPDVYVNLIFSAFITIKKLA